MDYCIFKEINFFSLSEFLIYFPQLIAGPILRAKELIPLLKKKIIFTNENIKFGILLFMIGFILQKNMMLELTALQSQKINLNLQKRKFLMQV